MLWKTLVVAIHRE